MRGRASVAVAAVLALLTLAPSASPQEEGGSCTRGEKRTIDVGIVKAIGCWTESESGGNEVYTGRWEDQPQGIDLNGFVLTGPKGGGLRIDTGTREVKSVAIEPGNGRDVTQINSRNWPAQGLNKVGNGPVKLDFVAPLNSAIEIEDLTFGASSFARGLAGLSPVGSVDTPVRLETSGTGSMDLTVSLAGIFTLKGKPQSVTIALETESGEGTKFDGFEFELEEVDAIKSFVIRELSGKYSISQNEISGSANVAFGFMKRKVKPGEDEKETPGIGGRFKVQNGALSELGVSVTGLNIPIGGVGRITNVGGGFHYENRTADKPYPMDFAGYCASLGRKATHDGPQKGTDAAYKWKCSGAGIDTGRLCQWQYGGSAAPTLVDRNDASGWGCRSLFPGIYLLIEANLGAEFGPPVPTPFGKIPPVRVDASVNAGWEANELVLRVYGGVQIFRIPVGDVYLALHSSPAVEFGVGLGIGFPSFKNKDDDPFYIGSRVDGWVGGGKFQLEGKGRISAFGLRLLDGSILVNHRAAASCWEILGAPGGVVFEYGSAGPRTFGFSCGLGDYREQLPRGARASQGNPRSFTLSAAERVLDVKGRGRAPRFTLRSRDGRVIRTPAGTSVLTDDHAFIVNEYTNTTHVVLRRPRGRWTLEAERGSAPVTSVKAARRLPKERVAARVRGRGHARTLVWRSRNRPNTRLVFTEVMPDGHEVPILETGAASGRHRFTAARGYGRRRLRVVIMHGYGSRQADVLDRYRIERPRLLRGPARVSAMRHGHDVVVRWSGVRRASSYLVEVTMPHAGRKRTSYVRRVSARRRSVVIRRHPSGARALAKVYAVNAEGRLGRPARRGFPTSPSVRTLRGAARLTARSAAARGGAVTMRAHCPAHGHCRARMQLFRGGRLVARSRYQQTPDTFRALRLVPKRAADRRALRGGARFRVRVVLARSSDRAVATAAVRR